MNTSDDRRLSRREAADYLTERGYRTAASTLAKLASVGGGPVFEKFGRRPLYTPGSLLSWVAARSSGPLRNTSE
jgi:hypothetical protein